MIKTLEQPNDDAALQADKELKSMAAFYEHIETFRFLTQPGENCALMNKLHSHIKDDHLCVKLSKNDVELFNLWRTTIQEINISLQQIQGEA